MNKSKVTADLKKNRLHVTLVGMLTKKNIESLYTEVRFCVADLKPGFTVINDLTQCRVGSLGGLKTYEKVREFLCSKSVGTVVRVVRKSQVVFKQVSRIIDKSERYRPLYATTLEEAEEKLNELEQAKE